MTIAENYWNKRGYSSRRGVFATFALAFALSAGFAPARLEAAPQESEAAPAAETPAEPPAPPTDEQRQAALEQIGVENASEIPNPVDDPAAAAAFSAKMDAALANPTPPAPEPSVAVELAPSFDPKKSYSRLLYPAVATRVGLSEEQKRRINELMSERAQKLGKATKEEWNNITLESEKALEAVLTPEQNDRFKRGTTEKTIVFHFSKERWADVLNWIAGECGLQLVMNAPPQGTFTYSDKTPYAPKDALDVLNSSLTFKGYTLFRYNDMLILHDFHTGSLPLQYLPKITPEDLPNQNKFDYVALTIPLERRNMAAVRTTIAPFMGPYCTLRSQGGNSLMVVDTVNALREIYAAAMSVHNPDPTPEERERIRRGPGQNNPPTPPETPTWRAYELEGISYQSLQEQIEVFAPSAKPLYNPQSDTLHYLAVPSVLNVIDGLVEKLKEGADPAKNAIVKTYSLDPVTPTTGPEIWAVARRLGGQQGGGGGRFGGGFPMQFSSDAREELYNYIIDSLSQIAPDARIELSGETRKLFVVANEADHAKIAATLESLAVKIDPEEEPVIKIYRVKKTSASSSGYFGGFDNTLFIAMRTTAPLAQTIPTSDGGLMVIATAKEQEAIAAIMKEFEASVDAPDQQNALKVYAMTARQVERFMQIYDQIASTPDMDGCVILPDWYIPTRFAVWAKPSQQAQIAKLIDQVVNAEAYVEADVEPKGLPEPQEPEKPAEPAPAPAPEQPAEPAPAPAPEKPAEPAPAPEKPAEPAPAPEKPAEPAPAPAPEQPAEPAPAPAPEKPVEPAPAPAPEQPAEPAPTPAPEKPVEPAPATAPAPEKPVEPAPAPKPVGDASMEAALNARFTVGNSSTYITVIPFKRVSISTARSLFINTIPGLDVSIDYASDSLIVYGPKSGVEAAIQLAARLENSLDVTLDILPLTKELPLEVVSALPRIEPNCVATYDRANSRLMIYGKPTDVARLKAYVSQIQESTTDEVDGVFYLDVERDVPGEIQDYAKRAVPGVELTYNRDSRRFTIIGTPTEQLATAKILTDAITNLPPEDETRYYRFDERIPSRLIELLNERVKGVNKIERDEFDKQALRVVAKPYQHELIAAEIEKIKTNYPFADQKEFVSYKTTKEVRASFEQVKNDFQSQYGEIKILQDNTRNSFAVWATPPQHEALKKLLDELASVESGDKESAQLYAPKYVDATTLVSVLRDLQPNLTITNDATNGRIIMRGTATELAEAKEALSMLDVRDENGIVRTFKSYPVKGFYSYDGVGSYYTPAYYVRDLSKLVPAARVTYDYYNQAIIVWGTEEEQAIVEQAVSNLAEKDQLDKRVLRWPIRRANYSTLSTQITAVYPGATPVYDSGSKTLIVRTTNGVALDAVKELLELLDPEQVSEFDPVLQYYDVGTAPSDDLVAAVQALVPNAAMVKIDAKNKQLLVIGTAVEQKTVADNVEKLAQTYGSSDLRMIPYPVYGMAVADLVASLTKAYPTAQVDADERGGRVLVRATLEDHVKISEEIARINSESGEATENPNDPDAVQNAPGPRVVVYEANTQMIATQLRGIVTSMFPGVEVFGGQGGYGGGYGGSGGVKPKVTILANGREQKMIASILESLNKTGDDLQFAVYPYGSAEAGAVEAIVGNLVPNAMSIPAMTKVDALRYYGPGGLSQRFRPAQQQRAQRQYGGFGADPNAPIPFYRIDEASRTVAILASPEAHEKIREAIEKLSSLSTNEARSTTKVYRLGPPIAPAIVQFVPQILPSLVPQMITAREFIAYGPAKDLEELDKFIGELSDKDFDRGIGRMRLFRVPAESKYNRDRIVTIINANFASLGISAYPGALPDQIITWGLEIELSKVEQMLDELFKQPNETTYKTYHISRTTLPSVIALLQQVVPNLEIVPNYQQRSLIVKGTEEDHARCKEAIDAFDKAPNDESALSLARYNWDDVASYWTIYSELQTQFAQTGAIIASASDTYSFVVTATEALQEDIATYIKRRRENLAEQTVQLRSYYLTNVNFTKVVQIVVPLLPRVGVYPGKGANEIFVIASPLDHDKFKMMLSTLETVPEGKEANGIEPKIYECSGQAAATAVAIIQPQLPGTVMYPLSGDRLIVWGSVSDHEYVSKALDTIGEAFPNNVLKRYPLIHIRFADALMYCQYRFPPSQAVFFSSTSGDLMVVAGPPVQEQVAKMLAEIDVENSEEASYVPVAYDISDIPAASHPYVSQAIASICYDCVQLPTSTPGFLVIYARPNEHKKVKKVIDEMLKDRPSGTRHMEAYSVRRMTLAQLSALILPLYPNVQIGAGTSANQVVILAKNEEHARIRELVDQLNEETDDGTSSRVYRLKNSQLAVARAAILEMFPHSTVVIDQMSRSVLVKAYADEQKKIEELVTEIDEKDPERNTSFKVFNIGSVNFTRLVAALRNFYSGDPAFQVQLDSTSQCLIVRGTAIQHKAVEDLIEEVRAGGLADPESYMQAYAVKSSSSLTSLYEIFWEQGREVNMFRDYYTGKLIVIGRPEDHKAVQDVLDLVAPEETELAVFDLLYVDPSTARQVFSMIETDGTYVDVRLDSSTNQLFIRATPAKLEEIRQVLIKMGEKELTKMKPFAETSQGGASATDGRRIYLRDNEKRQEEYQKSQGLDLIDPTRLEPIVPSPLAAATPAGPSLKVQEGTGPMRSVTVLGGDANQAVQQALKNWNLDNPVTVVKSDGGIVQEKGASDVPAVEAPKVEPAPEAPKAEEVKAEEPKTEEPKAEEPKAESSSVVPVTENATASAGLAPFFLRGSRSLLTTLCFGALVVDSPAAVDEAAVAASTENAPKPVEEEPKVDAPTEETNPESVAQEAESTPAPETTEGKKIELSQAPGVYVVVNPDGSLLLSSSDEKALEAFQKKLSEAVDEMKAGGAKTNATDLDVVLKGDEPSMSNSEPTAKSEVATETEEAEKETEDEDAPFDPNSYLSYMTPENIAKAKERIIMESRNYTVYKVENVGVSQIVPRLQTYLQDRINRGTSDPYSYYSSSGINMRTIGTSTRLTFQPDAAYNTLMVYGTKADREIVGAMLVVLDDAGLFPQPITKPYKVKVENTSPTRMAQQVLQAFSRKFQTTLMPGNLTPRIMPNNTTSSLEVYAPESLAKEIEEYVKEVDAEILEESVRKVRVVELKSMNSKILTQYMQNLMRQRVAQQMLSTPYIGATSPMMNPMMGANAAALNAAAARRRNMMLQGGYGGGFPPGAMGPGGVVPGAGVAR